MPAAGTAMRGPVSAAAESLAPLSREPGASIVEEDMPAAAAASDAPALMGVSASAKDARQPGTAAALSTLPNGSSEPGSNEPAASDDLDFVRERVCAALDQAGHNTAAALLGSGVWSEQDGGIAVRVAAKKTMLGLTMNAEATKICRDALRALAHGGAARSLTVLPGEGQPPAYAASKPTLLKPGATGSVQALALENPLVKQAQELFHAEVRSVVDLRNK